MFNRNLFKYGACLIAITLTVFLSGCGSEDSLELGGSTPLIGVEAGGETLYASGCNGCHGSDATGGLGPNIQGALPDMITATAGAGTMSSVSVTAQEAADISAFLTETDFTGYTPPGGGGGGGGADGASLYSSLSCLGCHGADATGGLGPSITTATAADIETAAGTGTMAGVSVTSEEATAIATYIATL